MIMALWLCLKGKKLLSVKRYILTNQMTRCLDLKNTPGINKSGDCGGYS